jgi:hypothetical protein
VARKLREVEAPDPAAAASLLGLEEQEELPVG